MLIRYWYWLVSSDVAKTATHAAVFAQLITDDGQSHGLHCFVVPIRDPNNMLTYPGVVVGDMYELLKIIKVVLMKQCSIAVST